MATILGILQAMIKILRALVPEGVDPLYFWLTFIISFAIIFLLLLSIPFFKDSRGAAVIVSGVISYFVASSAFVTIIISKLFPNIGIALMAVLGLLLLVAFLSPEAYKGGLRAAPFIAILAFLIVIWLTYTAAAPELRARGYLSKAGVGISEDDAAIIIIAIIVMGLIWILTRKEPTTVPKPIQWLFGKGWK